MAKNPKKEEKAAISPISYTEDIAKFEEIAGKIKEKHNLTNYDLIDILLKKRAEKHFDKIPVAIFDNKHLSALESIVKYLKENLKFGSGKIAKLLNRNISTISSTYLKARKKMLVEFSAVDSKYFIPLSEIENRNYSVLECIVKFLKEKHNLRNSEIAKLLNRDNRTIWTVYSRAVKKGGLNE